MIARQKPKSLLGKPQKKKKIGRKDKRNKKMKSPHYPHPEELHDNKLKKGRTG